ncbi:hypothetical protein AVEN_256723-1 [Araneus ventricosus]|uniref:EGF-like domain-containing protein n=1 Tax=Araneus ventricosus TaxID=182803 RepID=A0A4Y2FU12_ARAVE|nr:hypothetical protein AVEN_256723-1 [Araneus ventricosus]
MMDSFCSRLLIWFLGAGMYAEIPSCVAFLASTSPLHYRCIRPCNCEHGNCVYEGGKKICKCNPGYGNYKETSCIACDCGPDTNCMWKPEQKDAKICFCKPGYAQRKDKCVACDCGPDSNCTFQAGSHRKNAFVNQVIGMLTESALIVIVVNTQSRAAITGWVSKYAIAFLDMLTIPEPATVLCFISK